MTQLKPTKARAKLTIGTRLLDRYEIVDIVGRGGMSVVYQARDWHFPQSERWVAIKEMTVPRPQERDRIVAAFEREAHLLAQLRHPSIPVVYDYFTLGDRAYLVLEFIEGKTLDRVIEEAPGFFPEEQVLRWGIELCDVLHYLHTRPQPIIFRDLKPANIMVRPDNHLVLIDFGIARLFDPQARGTIIGTEGYAPPEQYRGILTPLVDIYALGATLHHLLTKKDPRREPPFSFAERPIRKINPNVSPELEAAVYKALAYRPEDRFQSAVEMKEALLSILRTRYERGETRVFSSGTTGEAPPTRTFMNPGPTTKNLHSIDAQVLPTTLPPDTRSISPGITTPAPKPVWVFACEDEIRSTAWVQGNLVLIGSYDFNLYALNLVDGTLIWKFATRGGIVSRPISDGRLVFFGSEDRHVYAVRLYDASTAWTFATQAPVRASPRLHRDMLYIGSDDGYLYAFHAASGRLLWRFPSGMPIRSTPWVMKQRIYFGNEDGEFFCLNTEGKLLWRSRARRAITSSPVGTEDTIYFASRDAQVYALDAESGWGLWRFRMGRGTVASPVYHEGYLYIGAADGILYCIRTDKGKERWRFQTEHQIAGSVHVRGNHLYFGATDHRLYCLTLDGTPVWAFETQGPITGTPVVDEQHRLLFIGSFDHHLYALPLE